jgi:hypothetical protein
MSTIVREMPELELALLRRGLDGLAAACERCGRCRRSLLIGERVFEYASGAALCELCANRERTAPAASHIVHGPEFGHTLRIIDRRDRTAEAA